MRKRDIECNLVNCRGSLSYPPAQAADKAMYASMHFPKYETMSEDDIIDIVELEIESRQFESNAERYRAQRNLADKDCARYRAERDSAKKELEASQADNTKLNADKTELEQKYNDLVEENKLISKLQDENIQYRRKIKEEQANVKYIDGKLDEQKKENQRLVDVVRRLNDSHQLLENDRKAAIDAKESAESELTQAIAAKLSAESDLALLKTEDSDLQKLLLENRKLTADITSAKLDVDKLRQDNTKLIGDNQKANADLQELAEQKKVAESNLEKYTIVAADYEKLKGNLDQLRQKLDDMKKEKTRSSTDNQTTHSTDNRTPTTEGAQTTQSTDNRTPTTEGEVNVNESGNVDGGNVDGNKSGNVDGGNVDGVAPSVSPTPKVSNKTSNKTDSPSAEDVIPKTSNKTDSPSAEDVIPNNFSNSFDQSFDNSGRTRTPSPVCTPIPVQELQEKCARLEANLERQVTTNKRQKLRLEQEALWREQLRGDMDADNIDAMKRHVYSSPKRGDPDKDNKRKKRS